jgi:hypothetical protein
LPKTSPAGRAGPRWNRETTYRVLSYYFSLRWNWAEGGELADRVLHRFAVAPDPAEERDPPTPGVPARYSLMASGPRRDRRFELRYGDGMLFSGPVASAILEGLFWHVNAETIRRTGDFLLVHAGAVVSPAGDGVLILGESGSGKTTLTAGLVRAGFGYLSDEAGVLDPVTRRLFPYPKALGVKDGNPHLLPPENGLLKGQRYLLPEEIRPGCVAGPCDVRFVVCHRYRPGDATTITSITPAAGVLELSRNALNLSIYGIRGVTLLSDVARGASHSTLVSRTLDEAVQAVGTLTGSPISGG